MIHIVGKQYFLRDGADVKVYSNAANVTLTVNGASQGTKAGGSYSHPNGTVINHVFYWTNVLQLGKNFEGIGDYSFDVVPSVLAGAGWIATKRQSDTTKTTNLTFDLPFGADIYIMITTQPSIPAWITTAGFTNTGVVGKWRDNNLRLVDYQLFKQTFPVGAHVALGSSSVDFIILVK